MREGRTGQGTRCRCCRTRARRSGRRSPCRCLWRRPRACGTARSSGRARLRAAPLRSLPCRPSRTPPHPRARTTCVRVDQHACRFAARYANVMRCETTSALSDGRLGLAWRAPGTRPRGRRRAHAPSPSPLTARSARSCRARDSARSPAARSPLKTTPVRRTISTTYDQIDCNRYEYVGRTCM